MNYMLNALTIDLEDWYHICGEGEYSDPAKWYEYEDRVTRNTEKIFTILDAHNCKATFFVLGYIAEKNPSLIKRIYNEGHEVGVHGYYHRRVFEMTRAEFEEDLRRSIAVVEEITNAPVLGYRAPEWSIRKDTLWAYDIMSKCGLKYDSSTVPLTRMGDRGFKKFPHRVETSCGSIMEFPLTTCRCLWENLPFTGGLPLRIVPYWFVLNKIRRINRSRRPAMVYIHPWEFDESQPKINLPLSRRFMHYFNIRSTRPKIEGILNHLKFAPTREVLGLC
ncbi:MAG: XrtA system polysaccharide deacetylase [Thermodesulfobacteriota bacterium]